MKDALRKLAWLGWKICHQELCKHKASLKACQEVEILVFQRVVQQAALNLNVEEVSGN